ncbi:hypothetical protein [Dictyobacter kobayashii]|uniref:Uncharacterized protein n=1 Tax=Dictyobacter kobayashii TaxID=2014872 RepID=A0A402ARJ6_9CHLR|nr:hypothetical protein [Dictyobacter kobayashii]GCE21715.1 hypothetical protein KDK_55150 [Dictyobacter kobayashii]
MDMQPAQKRQPQVRARNTLALTGCIILLLTFLIGLVALIYANYQNSLPSTNQHGFGAYSILFVLITPLLVLAAIGVVTLLSGLVVAWIKKRQR